MAGAVAGAVVVKLIDPRPGRLPVADGSKLALDIVAAALMLPAACMLLACVESKPSGSISGVKFN